MPTIGICTSAMESNISALIRGVDSRSVATANYIHLPYSDLDNFRLERGSLDGLILCHSINNRRMAITDVMDALYDKFLPHTENVLGKQNIAVVAHDFSWPFKLERTVPSQNDHADLKRAEMENFQIKQPTTFECASLVMICGRLDTKIQMDDEDWEKIQTFVANIRPPPISIGDGVVNLKPYLILAVFLLVCLAIFCFVVHITMVVVNGMLSALPVILIVIFLIALLIPMVCFLWQKFVVKRQIMTSRHGALNGAPHHWSSLRWWQMHLAFWKYYLPALANYFQKKYQSLSSSD